MSKQYTIFDQIKEVEAKAKTKERSNETKERKAISDTLDAYKKTFSDHNGNTYIVDKNTRKILSYKDRNGFIYSSDGTLKGTY